MYPFDATQQIAQRMHYRTYLALARSILLLTMSACLQTPRQAMIAPRLQAEKPDARMERSAAPSAQAPRFGDTAYVSLRQRDQQMILRVFATAQRDFDEQRLEAARTGFSQVAETLDERDSLALESSFMLSECSLQLNDFQPARQQLKKLLRVDGIPSSIRERSLLRLGQVHCAESNTREAEQAFQQFRSEFPRSAFLQFANCQSIQR